MSDLRAAALRYAARRWPVFPCDGKRPLVERGLHDASTDPATVEAWWRRWPEANVAVRTGSVSGVVVLDVDGDDGHDTLQQLEAEHGPLPATATVKTPGGGSHFYLRHPGRELRNSAGQLGHALDLRGDGGYVVVPPSRGPNGRSYEPDEQTPVAEMPRWLFDLAANGRRNGSAPPLPERIREGERNATLASLAGSMRRRGASPQAIAEALRVENRRCVPPLPDRELERIAASVGRYEPAPTPSAEARTLKTAEGDGARAVPAGTVRPERVEWLWPGRVPLAALTLLVGDPGLGKSLLTCWKAASASRAGAQVLMATAEDALGAVVRPRLEAVGADLERVAFVRVRRDGLEDGLALPDDMGDLERLVAERKARLLVVDPLMAHLPEAVNSWRDQSVRRALAPLHRLAEQHRCAVVVVAHLNKSNAADPLLRSGGSIGIPAAARSALLLAADPDDPDGDRGSSRVLAHFKCNLAPLAPSLRFDVETVQLDGDDRIVTARLRALGESPHTGRELLSTPGGEERTATEEAIDFLRAELEHGSRPASDLQAEARRAGITDKTLRSARERLGIRPHKAGFEAGWTWALPEDALPRESSRASSQRASSSNPLPKRDCGWSAHPKVPYLR